MAEAVDLSKLHGTGPVNDALERCASYGRFADGDLASILAHQQTATVIPLPTRAPEDSTDGQESYRLAQATAGKGVKPLT